MSERPLLLHSLSEFGDLIGRCLELVRPRRVVEIGGEGGLLTRELARWARGRDTEVHCVEPSPSPELEALEREGLVRLSRGKSPQALEGLPRGDVYFIDGDHNYYVVSAELAHIYGQDGELPMAVLHDVGWPCARRDQYYDPEDVPVEHRQPYSYDRGAVPGDSRLVDEGGFRGRGLFAYAVLEGGPRNGVLTAVEDYLRERPHLDFIHIPAVFGVGVLFAREAGYAGQLSALLGPLHENDLLRRLEENRIDLFLAWLAAHDREPINEEPPLAQRGQTALVTSLQSEVERVRAENLDLRLKLARTAEAEQRTPDSGLGCRPPEACAHPVKR